METQYNRTIYPELLEHLEERSTTVITGMRRVGKTTAAKWLLSNVESNNKIYFDLEKVENRYIFSQNTYSEIMGSIEAEGIDFSIKSFIAIDEVQLVPNIISFIKYIYDTYNVKFIITGSSSFYLRNHFTESLSGRKRIFELYPLSFREFVRFKGIQINWPKTQFPNFNATLHAKLNELYLEYLAFGGFPEIALTKKNTSKIAMLKDIINSYTHIDVKYFTDYSKIDEIYKLMKLLTARVGSKIEYVKIASLCGISRHKVIEYMAFLEETYFIKQISPFAGNVDKEISMQKKLYFTDNGILNVLGECTNAMLLENSVFNQLYTSNLDNAENLKYYCTKQGLEIDFVMANEWTMEVKETVTHSDINTYGHRTAKINSLKPMASYLVGLKPSPDRTFTNYIWAGCL